MLIIGQSAKLPIQVKEHCETRGLKRIMQALIFC